MESKICQINLLGQEVASAIQKPPLDWKRPKGRPSHTWLYVQLRRIATEHRPLVCMEEGNQSGWDQAISGGHRNALGEYAMRRRRRQFREGFSMLLPIAMCLEEATWHVYVTNATVCWDPCTIINQFHKGKAFLPLPRKYDLPSSPYSRTETRQWISEPLRCEDAASCCKHATVLNTRRRVSL